MDEDFTEGYRDGRDINSPAPLSNRSHCYRHGFEVGKSDREGRPAFGGATEARRLAAIAEAIDTPKAHPEPSQPGETRIQDDCPIHAYKPGAMR